MASLSTTKGKVPAHVASRINFLVEAAISLFSCDATLSTWYLREASLLAKGYDTDLGKLQRNLCRRCSCILLPHASLGTFCLKVTNDELSRVSKKDRPKNFASIRCHSCKFNNSVPAFPRASHPQSLRKKRCPKKDSSAPSAFRQSNRTFNTSDPGPKAPFSFSKGGSTKASSSTPFSFNPITSSKSKSPQTYQPRQLARPGGRGRQPPSKRPPFNTNTSQNPSQVPNKKRKKKNRNTKKDALQKLLNQHSSSSAQPSNEFDLSSFLKPM